MEPVISLELSSGIQRKTITHKQGEADIIVIAEQHPVCPVDEQVRRLMVPRTLDVGEEEAVLRSEAHPDPASLAILFNFHSWNRFF
jgi:hypothetical protein